MNSSPFLALLQMLYQKSLAVVALIVVLKPGHFFLDLIQLIGKKKKTNTALEISHSVFLYSISLRASACVDLNTKYAVRICRLV